MNLHLESLTREDLIQLVQKQLANQNEAYKQLEAVKKEAEENAKKQAEMTTKMEELKRALLASQQKVEELTVEMANQKHQKHLDSAKQAEEFALRNIQLEQEKAEVQEDLRQKLGEIEDMHKEVEEKSQMIAEKAKQIDTLLIQLNESSHQTQIGMPIEQQMKIQLSLETWYDWLAFVPRHRLGKIVPMVGDRKFASIVQKFLHEYGKITIEDIRIVAPYEEDPNGHPRVRTWQNNRQLRFEIAEAQMPANIKTFDFFELSYFDQSVLNFMQKFKQNGLLDNVDLLFAKLPSKNLLPTVLCHIRPLINGILSINMADSAQLVNFHDAENSKEIYELNMKMLDETRILGASYDRKNLQADMIDLYCRWLYQTARADEKPRVLIIGRKDVDYTPISVFIDRIIQDFLMATDPATFLIRIDLPKAFQPQENICLINDKTSERLVTKMEEADLKKWETYVLLISRHPLASKKIWMVNKNYSKRVYLSSELKIVPI